MDPNTIATAVAALSAVFAAIASVAALLQGHWARRQTEVQIYFYLRDRYLSPEMSSAFVELWDWRNARRDAAVSDWMQLRQTGAAADAEKFERLDSARRVVSRYYIDIARLHASGKISKQMARMATASSGIACLHEIVLPMGEARGSHWSPSYAAFVKQIRRSYNSGELD